MLIQFEKKTIWIYALAVLYIALILDVTDSLITVSFYRWLPLAVVVPGVGCDFLKLLRNGKLDPRLRLSAENFMMPVLIPTLIAVVTALFVYSEMRFTMSSIKISIYVLMMIFLAYYMIRAFGKHFSTIILVAGSVSYLTVFLQVIFLVRPMIFYPLVGISMEVHELTYVYGILFIYYLFNKKLTAKHRIICGAVCLMGIILGNKRALFLALAAGLAVYVFFHIILKSKVNMLRFICISMFALSLLWVFVIQSGLLEQVFDLLDVNDSSRLKMWNLFPDDYSLSPFYWGRGLSYTDVILAEKSVTHLHFSHAVTLHNDILRAYIGWGFIPFCYYILHFTYLKIINLAKQGKIEEAWIFLAVTIVYFIINFFDNNFFRYGMGISYYFIWYSLSYGFEDELESNIKQLSSHYTPSHKSRRSIETS